VACSLLGIRDESQVNLHYMKGALFENLILNEFIKRSFHRGENTLPYFWQDSHGKEIDCLLVDGENILPIEIKSGKTVTNSYFENFKYWRQPTGMTIEQGHVVYGGEQSLQTSIGSFISWRKMEQIPGY
jgi:predicted AAA+ superfamily ATPase